MSPERHPISGLARRIALAAVCFTFGCASGVRHTGAPAHTHVATPSQGEGAAGKSRVTDAQSRAALRMRPRLPNLDFRTQENKTVHFYDDLVRGRIVLINFMYARCKGSCPGTTANLVEVQKLLGARVGKDILMISISLDPDDDTEALKDYAERHEVGPGWFFLCGRKRDVETLRRNLGVVDPDPEIDADRTKHAGIVTIGNEAIGRWSGLPALLKPQHLVDAVDRISGHSARPTASHSQSSASETRPHG